MVTPKIAAEFCHQNCLQKPGSGHLMFAEFQTISFKWNFANNLQTPSVLASTVTQDKIFSGPHSSLIMKKM
jgi:hypothetical protein